MKFVNGEYDPHTSFLTPGIPLPIQPWADLSDDQGRVTLIFEDGPPWVEFSNLPMSTALDLFSSRFSNVFALQTMKDAVRFNV